MNDIDFSGQCAVITGAGAGIGRATALLLAARGARVVVNDPAVDTDGQGRPRPRAEALAETIRAAGGSAVAETSAVGSVAAARAIAATALEAFGRIDILINNAGIARPGGFDAVADADIEQVMTVNLLGPYRLMRAVWPVMRLQRYGRIVNFGSSAALGSGISGPYAASKGGLLSLTKDAAIAGAGLGIRVNAILPSAHTALLDNHPDPAFRAWMRRHLPPEAVAAVAAFLASATADCNGELLAAGGGHVARLAWLESRGICEPALTPETVRAQLGAIADMADGTVLGTQADHQAIYTRLFPAH